MLCERVLFYDGCNLNRQNDAVNKYSNVENAVSILQKGDVIKHLRNENNINDEKLPNIILKKYNMIVLCGHGAKNEISMGCGKERTKDPTKEISFKKFADSEIFFKLLKKYLIINKNRPSILFLSGCGIVDTMSDQSQLLQKISLIIKNVIIIAPATLVKPELKKDKFKIKFQAKAHKIKTEFDFIVTLGAYINGRRIEEIDDVLNLTKCKDEKTLKHLLCNWEIVKK